MKVPRDIVLVHLQQTSENEYVFANGHKIHLLPPDIVMEDGSYNPHEYTRIFGEVAAIPERLTNQSDAVWVRGNEAKYIDSIVPEVQVGDRMYFQYNIVTEYNLLEWEGKMYYKVPYNQIICVVRDGKIIPIGGHVLLDAYYGEGIIAENIDGHKVYGRKTSFGLLLPVTTPERQRGTVRHVGTPLKGEECLVKEGDLVIFPKTYDVRNTIEGWDYYTMRQHDLLAVL